MAVLTAVAPLGSSYLVTLTVELGWDAMLTKLQVVFLILLRYQARSGRSNCRNSKEISDVFCYVLQERLSFDQSGFCRGMTVDDPKVPEVQMDEAFNPGERYC